VISDRLVLAYHYPWYGYKEPKEWDKQATVADHPLLGPYRSADAKLIDFQCSLARDAEIDGFIVSWSGPEGTPGKIFEQMLDQLGKSLPLRFRLCLCVEHVANAPRMPAAKVQLALAYVLKHYGRHPAYLRVGGKPLVFVYSAQLMGWADWRKSVAAVTGEEGPAWYVAAPDGWDIDLEYLSAFHSIVPYADKYYTDEALRKNYQRVAKRVRPRGGPLIVAAIGGGSRVQKLGFDIDRSQGRYLRQRFQLARELEADWVTITSWNEWFEAMQIEPSREYGFEQIRHVREQAAAFHGRSLAALAGAALGVAQRLADRKTELTVCNTGRHNLYAVTAMAGGKKRGLVAYVLHPGESAVAAMEGASDQVLGFLVDGTTVATDVPAP